jgi:hypothetical protein
MQEQEPVLSRFGHAVALALGVAVKVIIKPFTYNNLSISKFKHMGWSHP